MPEASYFLHLRGNYHRADVVFAIGYSAVGDCRIYRGTRYDKKLFLVHFADVKIFVSKDPGSRSTLGSQA